MSAPSPCAARIASLPLTPSGQPGLPVGCLPPVCCLTIRRYLGYPLTERTPEYSSFTVFRQQLPHEVFDAVHLGVLKGLDAHGLQRGRNLGIDSSIIEANACLSGLASRNTEQSYRDYVKELAREAGVSVADPAAHHYPDQPEKRLCD